MKKAALTATLMMIVALFCSAFAGNPVADRSWAHEKNSLEYDTMTIEYYPTALKEVAQREAAAVAGIAKEEAEIVKLKARIAELDAKIKIVEKEIYAILGITEDDVIAAEAEIREIRQNLELLLGLYPEELMKRAREIAENEARINALKAKPVSYLWRIRDQIIDLESLLAQVKANLPDQITSYEVQLVPGNRDCLYRIAGKSEVYEDPTRWPEIYRANKSQINRSYELYKNNVDEVKYDRPEDLIFPGQVFDIPR